IDRPDMQAVRSQYLHTFPDLLDILVPGLVADREAAAARRCAIAAFGERACFGACAEILAFRAVRRMVVMRGLVAPACAEAVVALPFGAAFLVDHVRNSFAGRKGRYGRKNAGVKGGLHRAGAVAIWALPKGAGL